MCSFFISRSVFFSLNFFLPLSFFAVSLSFSSSFISSLPAGKYHPLRRQRIPRKFVFSRVPFRLFLVIQLISFTSPFVVPRPVYSMISILVFPFLSQFPSFHPFSVIPFLYPSLRCVLFSYYSSFPVSLSSILVFLLFCTPKPHRLSLRNTHENTIQVNSIVICNPTILSKPHHQQEGNANERSACPRRLCTIPVFHKSTCRPRAPGE